MAITHVNAPSAHTMFVEDIIANPSIDPQFCDPDRISRIQVYYKGTFPDRTPDISTPRTDAYIIRWEDKDSDDPFYKDDPPSN